MSSRNIAVSRFNSNLARNSASLADERLVNEYNLDLDPIDSKEDIALAFGPYSVFGDYIQVGNSRVTIPSPRAMTRSTSSFRAARLMGTLTVKVLSDDELWTEDIRLGPTVSDALDAENPFSLIPVISITDLVDLLYVVCYGRAVATESEGFIELVGEAGTYSIQVTGSIGRILGFPTKLSSVESGVFVDSVTLANLLGGVASNEEIYRGSLSISGGTVQEPLIEGKAILSTLYGSYIIDQNTLVPYKTLTPVNDLPTSLEGVVTRDKVVLPSMSGEVSSSEALGAYKVGTFSKFKPLANAVEGDVSEEGHIIVSSTPTYLEVSPPVTSGPTTFKCPRYLAALKLKASVTSIQYTLTDPTTYDECLELNKELSRIRTLVESEKDAVDLLMLKGGENEKTAFSKIRAAHLDLGYDRAWSFLSGGQVIEYMNLSEEEASYTGHIHALVNNIAPSVRSL
ncbi:MAG: hypothetical protein VXZ72_01555 [Chlamydiota bacterium]|nr:hypothetical protein [Chlamydiota bacterium]